MSEAVLKIWNDATATGPRRAYRLPPPADPSLLAKRLRQPSALDKYLAPLWVRRNHFAYRVGAAQNFSPELDTACHGYTKPLFELIESGRINWKELARWCKAVVSYPYIKLPFARPFMLPGEDAQLKRMIELADECKSRRNLIGISTIVNDKDLDFDHPVHRIFFNGILEKVYRRSDAERDNFFALHTLDRKAADDLFRDWNPPTGRRVWLRDGLTDDEWADSATYQIELIQGLRASARKKSRELSGS